MQHLYDCSHSTVLQDKTVHPGAVNMVGGGVQGSWVITFLIHDCQISEAVLINYWQLPITYAAEEKGECVPAQDKVPTVNLSYQLGCNQGFVCCCNPPQSPHPGRMTCLGYVVVDSFSMMVTKISQAHAFHRCSVHPDSV